MNPYPAIPFERRKEIVLRAIEIIRVPGPSLNETAHALGVSPSSLSRWMRAYREGGEAALRPRPLGRPRKAQS